MREPTDQEINEAIAYIDMINEILDKEIKQKKGMKPVSTSVYEHGRGRHLVVAKDTATKETIDNHKIAVLSALVWNDGAFLAPFTNVNVEDEKGNQYLLSTDLREVKKFIADLVKK